MATVTTGRVVQTPTSDQPYKVVLEYATGELSEHPVATVREGEAFIRSRCGYRIFQFGRLRVWNPPELGLLKFLRRNGDAAPAVGDVDESIG